MRRTKIIATIGPASDSEIVLESLIVSGMNVARINFSHGTHEYHRALIRRIQKLRDHLERPVAILQDLQGPKIRVGKIQGGVVELMPGQPFILAGKREPGSVHSVSVSLETLPEEVSVGDPILLADGRIELVVERIDPPRIYCRVIVGGALSSHKGVNLPGSTLRVQAVTDKDREDLVVGLEEGIDAVALSFVRSGSDLVSAREAIGKIGRTVPIIAKIEKHEAVENIDGILEAADGIMVARGDLGVEIDIERVPVVQKRIIERSNLSGKPVITATQMLATMVDSPRPTRAEASDVANAILDGTDAIMLSEETATGQYPVHAVQMMDRIARAAEGVLAARSVNHELARGSEISEAISYSSCSVAKAIQAAAIVTPTWSGSTARRVSRFRPEQPILATTPNRAVWFFLSFCWGVVPVVIPAADTIDEMVGCSIEAARAAGHLRPGQNVVITGGAPLHIEGTTNFVKVDVVR